MNASLQTSPPASPAPEEGSPVVTIVVSAGVLLAVLVALFLRRKNRPLPMDRLPEVARRQRMKGL